MMKLDYSIDQIKAISQPMEDIIELSSKIGDIGYAPDFSNNTLASNMENTHPLVAWLMNTPMTTKMRAAASRGLGSLHKDAKTGEWVLEFPYTVGTLPPDDTTGACCWVPLEIAKCGGKVPLRLLCLKDCENIMDDLINKNRTGGSNDLLNVFLRPGETVKDARVRMAKNSMAFFTAYNMINGTINGGTTHLKPFHGLLEVLESADVIKKDGANILGAFDSLACRWSVLGGGNYIIAVHPLTKMGIEAVIVEGKNNKLPAGWTRNGDALSFRGAPVIADKVVPVDVTKGTGEAWILEANSVGTYMATDLIPAEPYIYHDFTSTNDPAKGCAGKCDYYYNLGTVFNTNPNHLAVVHSIPLSANCQGDTLFGFDKLISPDTLVPMV